MLDDKDEFEKIKPSKSLLYLLKHGRAELKEPILRMMRAAGYEIPEEYEVEVL